eukprot:1670285-Amphidinium_carterae.1
MKRGVHTVWTDEFGRHNSSPHIGRCGVGYVTDTGEGAWFPLPGCRQSVFRAELLAVARALEVCNPTLSDLVIAKVWLKPCKPYRHRDLEVRSRNALSQACQLHWVKATKIDEGRITFEDFQ